MKEVESNNYTNPVKLINPAFYKVVNEIRKDTINLLYCLYLELVWKHTSLREEHFYLKALLENNEKAKEICGQLLVDYCTDFQKVHGKLPKVLDVGCGPVSSLAYLKYNSLADLIGVDPLAREYAELLKLHDKLSPVMQQYAVGEDLTDTFPEQSFDIVHIRNALDHCSCPALVWFNMFKLVKVEGILVHSHSIREATKEGFKQLHQYDLYPSNEQLWIKDKFGKEYCLTKDLPIQVYYHRESHNNDGTGWFTTVYKKQDSKVTSTEFMLNLVNALTTTYKWRSQWTFNLEKVIFKIAEAIEPSLVPLKIDINQDRF